MKWMTGVHLQRIHDPLAYLLKPKMPNLYAQGRQSFGVSAASQSPRLFVNPDPTLMDEKAIVRATGLPPQEKVTLGLKLLNPAEKLNFASVGHYITEKDGTLDLEKSAQLSNPYPGIDPMYPFWSLTPQTKEALDRYLVRDITQTQVFNFKLHMGHLEIKDVFPQTETQQKDLIEPLAEINCHRKYVANGVKREVVDEGGTLATVFLPDRNVQVPLVIVLSGGIHRGTIVEEKAALLAEKGFATAAIGYFGVGSLPKRYGDLDIEYFEDAINLICSKFSKNIDKERIGIMGFSKGGDISLGCVTFLPHLIKSAVLLNCSVSSIVFKLRYKGEVIDGLNIDPNKTENFVPVNGIINMLGIMSKVKDHPSTIIPFYRSPADILWMAGDDDHNFESNEYVQIAAEMAVEHGKKNFEYEIFPGLGHLLDLPYSPPATSSLHPLAPGLTLYMGGTQIRKHVQGQIAVWHKTIEFFNRTLMKEKILGKL